MTSTHAPATAAGAELRHERTYDFGALVPNRYGLEEVTNALTRMRAQDDIKSVIVPHANRR